MDHAALQRIPHHAHLPPGVAFPTADAMANPAVRRAFLKREALRLFVRVSGVVLDGQGNARQADILVIDDAPARWRAWKLDERHLVLGSFRIALRDTARAGLHIRVGRRVEDSPVDAEGYATAEPAFVSTLKIVRDGLYVVTPADAAGAGYVLPFGEAPDDADETSLLLDVLSTRYGCDRARAERVILGKPSLETPPAVWEDFIWDAASAQDAGPASAAKPPLERLRERARALSGAGVGLVLHGVVSLISHPVDILRAHGVPGRVVMNDGATWAIDAGGLRRLA